MTSHEIPPVKDASRRASLKTLGLGSLTALASSLITGRTLAQSTFQPGGISPEAGMPHQHIPGSGRLVPDDVPLAKLNGSERDAVRMAMLPSSASIESVVPNVDALTPAARRLTLQQLDSLRMGKMDGMGLGQLTTRDLASIGTAFGHRPVGEGGNGPAAMGCCCCCCFCAWCSGGSHGGSAK